MQYFLTSTFFKVAILSIPVFIILDLLWLSVVARGIYFKQLGYLAAVENNRIAFNLPVGLLVQVIIAFGLVVFISLGVLIQNTLGAALSVGAFAGFVLYCTYDLTNLSFVKDYPLPITLIDIGWGTLQGFLAGLYVFYLTKAFSS